MFKLRKAAVIFYVFLTAACLAGKADRFRMDILTMKDEKGKLKAIRKEKEWFEKRARILDSIQLVTGKLPDAARKVPADMKILEEDTIGSIRRLKITYAAEDNDRVPAYLLIPSGNSDKVPGILCLHQTTSIGKAEPAGLGGSENLHYALELAEHGYVTLAPDYPNFGDYIFDPYSRGYVSATMKGIWNHIAAIDLLQSLPEVDSSRIGCIGHSLGGHNSLFLAVFDRRVKAVVTSCGFTSFSKYYSGDLTGWSHRGYMPRIASVYGKDPRRMPFDFPDILSAIAPRALFINAPLKDANFEISGVYDCVNAAKAVYSLLDAGDKILMINPDSQHDFPPVARTEAYRFLDRELHFMGK